MSSITVRDPYYGYGPIASLSTSIISILFPPTAATQDQPCHVSAETGKRLPKLIDFIAYALYRTRLPDAIVHSALLLLTRLKQRYPSARGTPSSPHRLFLSALMLASKMSMDDTYSNKSWVIVGQNMFNITEVNRMERELFGFLNSNCYITKAELASWCREWCGCDDEEEGECDVEAEAEVEAGAFAERAVRARMGTGSTTTGSESSEATSPVSCSTTTTSSPPPTPDEALAGDETCEGRSKYIGRWDNIESHSQKVSQLTGPKKSSMPSTTSAAINHILNSPIRI